MSQICAKLDIGPKFFGFFVPKLRSRQAGTAIRFASGSRPFSRGFSRGEEIFNLKLEASGILSKFEVVRELQLLQYRLDFAFPVIKLDVEIDGSQHYSSEHKAHDGIRDSALVKLGWTVYRIDSTQFLARQAETFSEFADFLNSGIFRCTVHIDDAAVNKTVNYIEHRKRLILDSGIDFNRRGWGLALGKLLEIASSAARVWVRSNMPEFYANCWHRNRRLNAGSAQNQS